MTGTDLVEIVRLLAVMVLGGIGFASVFLAGLLSSLDSIAKRPEQFAQLVDLLRDLIGRRGGGMSWREAYAAGVPAVHRSAQGHFDAQIWDVAHQPEMRDILYGDFDCEETTHKVRVPVGQVGQQLVALGIDPTCGWK
ncbi:MAG TPA: hypothetical protein VKV37_10380 [Ktedonobacteraceae bacterium]|nr:hypothetical protein [Ktedonobacteraceae bacterium]